MEGKTLRIQNLRVLQMIRGLFLAQIAFEEIFKKYKKGQLHFSDIEHWVDDRGQSLLYPLKEHSHAVFRQKEKGLFHKEEWLLDLVVGSIFHEAMKLRENIYQLEFYRPQYLHYRLDAGKTVYEKDYLTQFEKIIARAEQGLAEGMEETRSLFQDAQAQLLDFFKANSANAYLIRFLIEHQSLLDQVYGPEGQKRVFQLIFKNGLLDALSVAGESYLESAHYDLSSLYLSKALELKRRKPELRSLLYFSRGMDCYYRNDYSGALSSFLRLTSHPVDGQLKKDYLTKAEEACRKIASEWREEKRRKAAERAESIAEQIKKMLGC